MAQQLPLLTPQVGTSLAAAESDRHYWPHSLLVLRDSPGENSGVHPQCQLERRRGASPEDSWENGGRP